MTAMDDSENFTTNPRIAADVATMGDLVAERLSRRGFLGGLGAVSGLALAGCAAPLEKTVAAAEALPGAGEAPAFRFTELARGLDETHHVAPDHQADVLIRWGDALFTDSPPFEPMNQTAEAQRRQFGFNNDFIGYIPLERDGEGRERAILCINHEYTTTHMMLPGVAEGYPATMTKALCEVEMAAHGGTILEIRKEGGKWHPVVGSPFNRRITADTTPMQVTGPAAGHPRLQTTEDPTGTRVAGTMNNCAGGITPWGTYLMAEENFNGNFLGALPKEHREAKNHARYGVPSGWYQWGRFVDRFDVSKEPHEPNRFGWIVEVDPMDPQSTPKKRTALGRVKHEGAESVVAPDGRVVVYTGDDQRFDYVYKFVTKGKFDAENRAANMDLLDEGTLYVARFDADGTLAWLPVVYGTGPLTEENGFASQADVLIDTRLAADLLGATPMDRPEDIEPNPKTGRVYVMLTNNDKRKADQVDAANPRPANRFGHIIEIIEPEGDFASETSRWEILVRCGDPSIAAVGATWNPLTSPNGWLASPDNCAIDPQGRLWVATDGNDDTGAADGIWALETDGARRGTGHHLYRCPAGAEMCGPRFNTEGDVLFVAVQHPGETDGSSFEKPGSRWPDFDAAMPPRPSVVVITRKGGGPIGG
ncbi:PhoX family phosphatase [Hyphomonas sp. WL0036]|uniref:PhoX family protein n=1 Tax=Hyphomonas sediminis TaxID=2866160 RepID=UPI001C816373|nr:PhoX family phosphatase [Hyphomonas sediminis]MBY9067257.1 PhoX family phosphatase [Hyphomonas sediminis]